MNTSWLTLQFFPTKCIEYRVMIMETRGRYKTTPINLSAIYHGVFPNSDEVDWLALAGSGGLLP